MSRHDRTDALPSRPSSWSAVGWLLVVAVTCGVLSALALPDVPLALGPTATANDLFHPEWLVAGTLIAYPLARLARASLVLGLLGLLLSAGEMFMVADTAMGRLADQSLHVSAPAAWYAIAAGQSLAFAAAAAIAGRRRWADRRWDRLVKSLMTEPGLTHRSRSRSRTQH